MSNILNKLDNLIENFEELSLNEIKSKIKKIRSCVKEEYEEEYEDYTYVPVSYPKSFNCPLDEFETDIVFKVLIELREAVCSMRKDSSFSFQSKRQDSGTILLELANLTNTLKELLNSAVTKGDVAKAKVFYAEYLLEDEIEFYLSENTISWLNSNDIINEIKHNKEKYG